MTCTIIGAVVVSCLVGPADRLTPAEGARVLAPHAFVYVPPPSGEGPRYAVIGAPGVVGPFGAFAPVTPRVRLDGSPLTVPAWRVSTWSEPRRGRRR